MTAPQSGTPPGDRLNGWKEIAAFLGKGARTAQRWEHELGLPVHRIGQPGGEIVYAFRSEIDRWSRGAEQHARSWPTMVTGATRHRPPSTSLLFTIRTRRPRRWPPRGAPDRRAFARLVPACTFSPSFSL